MQQGEGLAGLGKEEYVFFLKKFIVWFEVKYPMQWCIKGDKWVLVL